MKLNPSKCAFGVSAGKFLGLWSAKGDRSQPDQVKAVMETPPQEQEGVTRLTGKLVALGRFIARFTDELRPFFLAIRKAGTRMDGQLPKRFEKLNIVLCNHPSSSPSQREIIHVSGVSEWAISAVLFRCPSPKEQKPIYYVSRALADVETRYSKMELTALALRSAAQKLRPYFQAHPVIVLTDQPLRNILHKPDLTGRMLQWAIELSEFGIEFQPRLSMKGQVMADFVLEYSRRPSQHHESSKQEWWTLRVDGASRSSGSGVGLLLQSPTGEHLEQAIRLGFSASNNEAEYEAILSGLDLALALSVSKLRIYSDSQLVLPPSLSKKPFYCLYMCNQPLCRRNFHLQYIEANQADDQEWTYDIRISPDRHSTRRSQTGTQSPGASCPFHPDWGHLYKRSFTGPYLRCLGHSEAQYVLAELHEGICGIIRRTISGT
ncbi:Retrovirus-related Pol polyprotein from transposon 297 [Vitis vinifera]|uniref:Retrovirus-related Pol polyprotein from transposon 297 n=1 Tax=Vitis vinifera TaxID=29760 RepID=A0A438GFS1_VITVI|nr:Retrovirus-related Pol polyprotein from transposon 297 [Vitis vinifera]